MPPKRKAPSNILNEAPPAAKRTLRKKQPVTPAIPTRRSRRGRTSPVLSEHSAEETQNNKISEAATARITRQSSRPTIAPASPVSEASGSRVQLPEPITTTRRGNHAQVDEEFDEFLLGPSKKWSVAPVTPPRTTTPKATTPRAFMQCVEIVTPSKRLLTGTPAPRPVRKRLGIIDLLNTPLPSASGSPTKRSTRNNAPPSRQRPVQLVHGSPSPPHALLVPSLPSRVNSPPPSPSRRPRTATAHASPSKRRITVTATSPNRPISSLPPHLHSCLYSQQRAILKSLRDVPDIEVDELVEEDTSANAKTFQQLTDLLRGTVVRGEGNSCLLIGPRGSGKTRLVEQAIHALPETPIIIRLSGHAQQNDRQAIREIARQLTLQTGSSFLLAEDDKPTDDAFADPDNPFLDNVESATSIALPAPAHLLALISMIPTLPRATVVVIDAFDNFATHARQSLLYCLLDTAQSCRVGKGNKGLAVIGVTTRVDTINLLEKRVKSRFSGRMLRTACPSNVQDWISIARAVLTTPIDSDENGEWATLWAKSVDEFLRQDAVLDAFKDSYALTRDVHTLRRTLIPVVLELSAASPFLSGPKFTASMAPQRCPPRFPFLASLSYPAICLLIAAVHAETSGHDNFTFEMLHEAFRDQVRTSQSAPVQLEGGSIGMVRCSREVLLGAFERLVLTRIFIAVAPPSSSIAKEFQPHRCAVDRFEVKKAVEALGQTALKKWLNKLQ